MRYRIDAYAELHGRYEIEADSWEQADEIFQAMIDSGEIDDTDSAHWTSGGIDFETTVVSA